MRTNEERIAALHRRAGKLKREKTKLEMRMAGAASAASGLLLLFFLTFHMPGPAAAPEASDGTSAFMGMSGSIFSVNDSLAFVVIAILAFLLGVSVTVFCFLWKQRREEPGSGEES